MSGNGGDNAHNNAFGGGKNPGSGNSGPGGGSGSSGNGGNTGEWSFDSATGTYSSSDIKKGLKSIKINSARTFTVLFKIFPDMPLIATVVNGDINNIKVDFSSKWRGPKDKFKKAAKNIVKEFVLFKRQDEKETLLRASEIITDMRDKVGKHLGDKYKSVAKDIANNIKNFQGKTVRQGENVNVF